MTRKEAIKTLANFKRYISGGGVTDLKANEALDMAMDAIVAQGNPIICPRCGRTFAESEGRERDK